MNKKCQVFTPNDYVNEILDSVDYNKNLYGKKILENSCGDGNILAVVVQRYIDDCKNQGLSRTKIRNGLSRDIYGVEIDKLQFDKCLKKIDEISVANGIYNVNWSIFNEDYLRWDSNKKFRYIVGNPPYITYKELAIVEQEFVRENYITCTKGKFDYCYAFIEKSTNYLDSYGKMAYLIPSSIYKTVFGLNLRNFIKPLVETIKDYTQKKLFDDALVKSSILVLNKKREGESLVYIDMTTNSSLLIPVNGLGDKWFFTNKVSLGDYRFGDFFKVSHVVATLYNDAFVLDADKLIEFEGYYKYDDFVLEKEVVKPTAAPRSLRYNKVEHIIFPYKIENNKSYKYSVDEFELKFPGVAEYLSGYRDKLDDRKSDKNSKWFEYGRSQALGTICEEKLLISTVITEKVSVYKLISECIPYAGMYITMQSNIEKFTFDDARKILMSDEFMQYVKNVGIPISGNSLRITSKDIANFRFTEV